MAAILFVRCTHRNRGHGPLLPQIPGALHEHCV